jgi:small subunit ribosomal protein S20
VANHKSAKKEHRQSEARRDRNRAHRSRLRTALKGFRKALEAGEAETARGMLVGTLSLLDRTAKLGAINGNAADRTKSRLTRALNRVAAVS